MVSGGHCHALSVQGSQSRLVYPAWLVPGCGAQANEFRQPSTIILFRPVNLREMGAAEGNLP